MVTILMMSAKMATPDLLKIIFFWNKGYDVINFVYDITKKVLSHDSNYIVELKSVIVLNVKIYLRYKEPN